MLQDGDRATPFATLSGLQSWIVTRADGNRRIVFTTSDGMTIEGKMLTPDGRDLTAALLGPGASPMAAPASEQDASVGSSQRLAPEPVTAQSQSASSTPEPQTIAAQAGNEVVVPAKATTLDELLDQATRMSVWFSAGNPKPNAPVVYMMADPTCPYCAQSVDKLASKIESGDIDLRVILAPIRNQDAVFQAASILQSQDPAGDFVTHERSQVGTTSSTLTMFDRTAINPDVVRGLQRNVAWGRLNGVKGVPFWIYQGPDGAKVRAGLLADDMLSEIEPLPKQPASYPQSEESAQ